jgi:hypothetical protein
MPRALWLPLAVAQVVQWAVLVVSLLQVGFHQREVLAQYRVVRVPHELAQLLSGLARKRAASGILCARCRVV